MPSLLNEFWAEAVAGNGGEAGPELTVCHGIAILPTAEQRVLLPTLPGGLLARRNARSPGLSRDEAVEIFDRGRAAVARQDGLRAAARASAPPSHE